MDALSFLLCFWACWQAVFTCDSAHRWGTNFIRNCQPLWGALDKQKCFFGGEGYLLYCQEPGFSSRMDAIAPTFVVMLWLNGLFSAFLHPPPPNDHNFDSQC